MQVRITQRGVFDADGKRLEKGASLTIEGDEMPAWLKNKAVPIEGQVAITNPAPGTRTISIEDMPVSKHPQFEIHSMSEDDLRAELEAGGADVDGRWGVETLREKVTSLRGGGENGASE